MHCSNWKNCSKNPKPAKLDLAYGFVKFESPLNSYHPVIVQIEEYNYLV